MEFVQNGLANLSKFKPPGPCCIRAFLFGRISCHFLYVSFDRVWIHVAFNIIIALEDVVNAPPVFYMHFVAEMTAIVFQILTESMLNANQVCFIFHPVYEFPGQMSDYVSE